MEAVRRHSDKCCGVLLPLLLTPLYKLIHEQGPLSSLNDLHCPDKETLEDFSVPVEILCYLPFSPVLQQHPEVAVDKQWEQTIPPTSIDLVPLPPPTPRSYQQHHIDST